MRKGAILAALVFLLAGAFLAGSLYTRRISTASAPQPDARIVSYVCSMHPDYHSDRPGNCPICGMRLEQAGTGGEAAAGETSALPPGTFHISAERQQLIGVQLASPQRTTGDLTLRTVGRVATDESRVYRINAAVDGWITKVLDATTGTLVKKDQELGIFYSPEFLSAEQSYFFTLASVDNYKAAAAGNEAQAKLGNYQLQGAENSLLNLGMGRAQLEEIARTRQVTQDIRITAPADGFIVARNVSPGQRFAKGEEFFRIADLSHVWVLADIFENEAEYYVSGRSVMVRYQGRTLPARASEALPQFDGSSRTLKVRFEVDNPGYRLRPDMFVDLELSIGLPAGITVPTDAVLNSGKKRIVFVARGGGYFEPREVETGWRFNDRVAIAKGLMPNEQIAVSGNFLLDSESRMRMTGGEAVNVRGGAR